MHLFKDTWERKSYLAKWFSGIAGAVLIAFFTLVIFLPSDTIDGSLNIASAEQANQVLPVHLKIPTIDVDSALERVGLTSTGAVDVPKGPENAAWFDKGKLPGESGTAVIVGHFGWKDGIPAVFDDLHSLHAGDVLYVEDSAGMTTTFVVREVRTYGEHEDATSVFTSSDGKSHLNLITCTGVWNKDQKSYSERVVVFTDKVGE